MKMGSNTAPDLSAFNTPQELTYATYRLDPHSSNLPFLAGKYAALSLRALTTDPNSFGMGFETEASFTPAEWIKRTTRPDVHIFICVAHPMAAPPALLTLEHGAWVGMVTQLGPTPKSTYYLPLSGAPEPLSDELETKWHQTATWIDPAHRGKGVAKQMVETAVAYAGESIKGTVQQARVRMLTGPDNQTSMGLYGGRGFVKVGLCTPFEGMVGNGNSDYPFHGRTDWPEEVIHMRAGIVMERLVVK